MPLLPPRKTSLDAPPKPPNLSEATTKKKKTVPPIFQKYGSTPWYHVSSSDLMAGMESNKEETRGTVSEKKQDDDCEDVQDDEWEIDSEDKKEATKGEKVESVKPQPFIPKRQNTAKPNLNVAVKQVTESTQLGQTKSFQHKGIQTDDSMEMQDKYIKQIEQQRQHIEALEEKIQAQSENDATSELESQILLLKRENIFFSLSLFLFYSIYHSSFFDFSDNT